MYKDAYGTNFTTPTNQPPTTNGIVIGIQTPNGTVQGTLYGGVARPNN